MKNTITECISGNTLARMNSVVALDSSRSVLSFPYRKLDKIVRENIIICKKQQNINISSNNEMKNTIAECFSGQYDS